MAQSVEKRADFCLSERLVPILACPDCRRSLPVPTAAVVWMSTRRRWRWSAPLAGATSA